jgi:hypothetical protein
MEDKRLIGVRLNENELATLNLYLQGNGYSNLSDFVRAIIEGKFSRNELTDAIRLAFGAGDLSSNLSRATTISVIFCRFSPFPFR